MNKSSLIKFFFLPYFQDFQLVLSPIPFFDEFQEKLEELKLEKFAKLTENVMSS